MTHYDCIIKAAFLFFIGFVAGVYVAFVPVPLLDPVLVPIFENFRLM